MPKQSHDVAKIVDLVRCAVEDTDPPEPSETDWRFTDSELDDLIRLAVELAREEWE